MILAVIFIPPLYFLLRRRWAAFVINSILYVMALATLMVFGLGVLFWFLAMAHAWWAYWRQAMDRQAERMAGKIATRIRVGS